MRYLVLLFTVMLSGPALALSCLVPSVERSYAEADAAAERYLVVEGRLTLNARQLPKSGSGTGTRKPPEMTRISSNILGKSMSSAGFVVPFDQDVVLEVACFGPWCGSVRNGDQVLAFVRRDGGEYLLSITPCGGDVFVNPKPSQLKTALDCHRGADCTVE